MTLRSSKDDKYNFHYWNVVVDSNLLNTYIGGKNVIIDAKDTLILRGGSKIIREDDSAEDKVKGTFGLSVGGGYNVRSGSMGLSYWCRSTETYFRGFFTTNSCWKLRRVNCKQRLYFWEYIC